MTRRRERPKPSHRRQSQRFAASAPVQYTLIWPRRGVLDLHGVVRRRRLADLVRVLPVELARRRAESTRPDSGTVACPQRL
jgi:hypothetical protein